MWFKLASATFTNNLGTMSELSNSWPVSYSLSGGISKNSCPSSVAKNGAGTQAAANLTVTFTLASGSTLNHIKAFVGGTEVASATSGTSLTIDASKITGPVTIEASATGASTGGGEPDVPVNPPSDTFTAIPYTSQLSVSGLNKTDGSILSSGTGYVNVYENLDFNKTYYASGYAPGATGSNACVCYYKADGTFISSESGSDWGISSEKYEHRQLTIPADTAIIKLFGRTNAGEGCTLEIGANYILISHSEINEKSNLTKSDGTLGTSSTGVVKTYNNIDASKTYVADGFCPNATGSATFVCYYNSSNVFIDHQDGNDFGLSSKAASKVTLTVPSGTSTIKLFGQGGTADPYLYTLE